VHLPTRAIVRRPRHSARRRRWCADRRARRGVPLGRPLALLAGRRERRPDRAWSAFAAQCRRRSCLWGSQLRSRN